MNDRGTRGVDPNGTPSLPPDDGVTLADVQAQIDRLDRKDRAMLRPWMIAHYGEDGAHRPTVGRE